MESQGWRLVDARGSADSHRTPYRPYIDGLRAIAVLAVILFHMSGNLLPGGYLGVDVFFVISGYLITNVIWREAINRDFSILRFYERRVRRIMPALLALLIVVSAASCVLLLPIDLTGFAKSMFAGLGFVANVYFWRDTNYFAQVANDKPLLHLWSLGVEEQFYILFPMLVVICVRWRRALLFPVVAFLVLVSLAGNMFALRIGGANPAFFLLPTRAWEIGAGCLLALAPSLRVPSVWASRLLGVISVALLVVGVVFNGFGLWGSVLPPAIWAVSGTTLTIFSGESGGSWFTVALSARAMVWVGLISYSLYLWHWPILVFARYYTIESSIPFAQGAGLFALMILLAWLSWRFVERPFRNRSISIRRVLVVVGSATVAVSALSAAVLAKDGFPNRYGPAVARINAATLGEYRCAVSQMFYFGSSRGCMLNGAGPDKATVALVGNSHAQMYAPLIAELLRAHHMTGILAPLNGCLPIPDYNISPECMREAAGQIKAVEALPNLRVVILSMTWNEEPMYNPSGPVPAADEQRVFYQSLDRVIQLFEQEGKTVILIGPVAEPGYDAPSIVARQMAFGRRIDEPLYQPEEQFLNKYGLLLSQLSAEKDLVFIRPDRIQCRNGKCDYFRDGVSFFADSNHIAQGSLWFFRPMFEEGIDPVLSRIARKAR